MDDRKSSTSSSGEDQDEDDDIKQQQAIGKAIRNHRKPLSTDLQASYDELVDFLIENNCLSPDEAPVFNDKQTDNLRDKVVKLISTIIKRSFDIMSKFLQCVKKFHPYIVNDIYQTYEKSKENIEIDFKCGYCFLRASVDLSTICTELWTKGHIEDDLFDDVINLKSSKRREKLWKMFADECNSYESHRIKLIITKIRRYLRGTEQYCELVRRLRRLQSFHCECDSMNKDHEQKALEKMAKTKCLPPRRVSEPRLESTCISSEVDGGISRDPLVSDNCQLQGEILHHDVCEERKKACLEKAIGLNKLALTDCLMIALRSTNYIVDVKE